MKIISHRAINKKYPENSLPAIKWTFESGNGIEADIRVNKSGSLVIIHDENGGRLFGDIRKIIDMSNKECRFLVYKSHSEEKIGLCTFEEVCKTYKEVGNNVIIALHIKDINEPKVVEKTIEVIRKYGLQDNCFLFATADQTIPLIEFVKEKYTDIKIGLHLPENSPLYTEESFNKADVIWLDEESGNWLNNEMIKLAKKTNSQIYCMSPEFVPNNIFQNNYKERWKDLIEMGFDAIVTDYAEELKEFIKNSSEK